MPITLYLTTLQMNDGTFKALRLAFRFLRDSSNPFNLPYEKCIKLFSLNKQAAHNLVEEIK